MKRLAMAVGIVLAAGCAAWTAWGAAAPGADAPAPKPDKDGWYDLFNGKDLAGWKVSENPDTFRVEDGAIVAHGPRAHAFYVGPVAEHDFRNFELQADVKTAPKANSGIYFHTAWQESGYPAKGHEAQVSNTHSDWRKTGSLYAVQDVKESPVKDGEWFRYEIAVRGKRIVLKVNGRVTVDWTEPENYKHPDRPQRGLSHGTFALQGHDPESQVWFKNLRVRPLAD